MSNGTDQGLSGQQLSAMQKRMTEVLQNIRDQAELRKQCLEMAIRALPANASGDDVMELAKNMLRFMTEPSQDVHVTIVPP